MVYEREFRKVISATEKFVREETENEGSGHDWWHISRVRNLALKISEAEGGDRFLVEMAALLHDIDDWKNSNDPGISRVEAWLGKMNVNPGKIQDIKRITDEVSFRGAGVDTVPTSLEARIVQDADRLDAMGAIGIARAFAFGGSRGRIIFDPLMSPEKHTSFEEYKKNQGPTINHFYEKLLLLKDRLNTGTAKKIAIRRHRVMQNFLEEFFMDWNETGAT